MPETTELPGTSPLPAPLTSTSLTSPLLPPTPLTPTPLTLTPFRLTAHHHLPPRTEPPGTDPHVWLVETAEHHASAARHAPAVLDRRELRRVTEFARDGDRASYVCAHVALRRLLGAYLGLPPRRVTISRAPCAHCGDPHGRPVLPGEALHFSLSHCAGLSLMAFATRAVGVDVEAIPSLRTVAETADILHPREAAELARLTPAERTPAFTRVWTRKEAYLKGLGVGLSENPAADYVGSGPVPTSPPGWALTDVAVPPGHCAAVALRLPDDAPGTR